jgi:hypothetical protein
MRPLFVLLAFAALNCAADPIGIDPENSRYFLFRGKPLVMVTASEHYGSVVNRTFDFERYLDDAAAHHMTLTRTFLLYRELQSPRNPSSPVKPESPDFVTPYLRTGPGAALDGEPIYDLDRFNPEYFERLHHFLQCASDKGIVVELVLFSNTYERSIWALNPLNSENNKQGVGHVSSEDYTSLRNHDLFARQLAYVRKTIEETAQYDNAYYEICNEPSGGSDGHATAEEVDAWQAEVARVVHEEMLKAGRIHLLSGQTASTWNKSSVDQSFRAPWLDIVNVHPLPGTILGGHTYELGGFMSKELKLVELAAFIRAVNNQTKPVVVDEDNAASLYRDQTGWTIHRKRAWMSIINGGHYDYIDFSITVGSEAGTSASRAAIRSWMQYLSSFIHSFDFIHAKPAPDWIKDLPDHVVCSGLAAGDGDYIAYLADVREVTDASAGQPVQGTCGLDLPQGRYQVSLFSPTTGEYSPAVEVIGGKPVSLALQPFRQDIVLRARRLVDKSRSNADK